MCRESLRLCRSPLLSSRLHTFRSLAAAASTPPQNTTASDSGDQFDVRQQLREGKKLSKAQIKGYKVAQLREALQEEGLSTKGLKAELVERLYELVQALSEESKDSTEAGHPSSTAEGSSQAEHPSTLPEELAQDALQSHALEAQPGATESHEDATPGASAPATASASDSEGLTEAASSSVEKAEDQPSSFPAVNTQRSPGSDKSASADSADSTAAAASVRGAAQQSSSDKSRDLTVPDPVASKTGMYPCTGLFRNGHDRLKLRFQALGALCYTNIVNHRCLDAVMDIFGGTCRMKESSLHRVDRLHSPAMCRSRCPRTARDQWLKTAPGLEPHANALLS